MILGERIKKVRRDKDLTQYEFGKRIGIKANSVSLIESGNRNASDQVIISICREFNVNETWLRTGEGEMFVQRSRDDELASFVDELLAKESTDFRRRLVTALSRLNPEQWDVLEAVALELMKNSLPSPSPEPVLDAASEIAKLKRQNADLLSRMEALEKEDEAELQQTQPVGSISRSR